MNRDRRERELQRHELAVRLLEQLAANPNAEQVCVALAAMMKLVGEDVSRHEYQRVFGHEPVQAVQ